MTITNEQYEDLKKYLESLRDSFNHDTSAVKKLVAQFTREIFGEREEGNDKE